VKAAAAKGVRHVPRRVRGEHDERRMSGFECAELGDRDLVLRQNLEQESFELGVGSIDLVDEEHGGAFALEDL
jgi:hypothetical protein